MKITIVHTGGATKEVEFLGFDAPRAWIRVRYPSGAGIFGFALEHGFIEHKRGETPAWRITQPALDELRAQAKELKIKFSIAHYTVGGRHLRPRRPRKKTDQKQTELFGEHER